jgi:DNA repair photolyase
LISFQVDMKITEKSARSILTRSNIPGVDFCLNPFVGCAHACRYCYATFMCRFSGHEEPWGTFVEVKVNALPLLRKALRRRREGEVMLSSVTDPYQPVEKTYRLTRACLELLGQSDLEVGVLTKSGLVARDIDILSRMPNVEVGLSITTDREEIRRLLEPGSSPIDVRIGALERLHSAGIATYVFVGPILPMDPEKLVEMVSGFADRILIDRLNYQRKVRSLYARRGMGYALEDSYFEEMESRLVDRLTCLGKPVQVV